VKRSASDTPKPLIGIVLPTYNGARHLDASIESCLEQTWRHLELIVVDDGSTDPKTGEILARWESDARLRLVRLAENGGLPRALNAGFRETRGEMLTWTSDDNLYRPDALEVMARELERGGADFVYAAATAIDDEGKRIGAIAPREPQRLIIGNCVGPCFLFTRQVFESTGWFDPAAALAEDYDYWVRVSKRFRMRPIQEDLYLYRFHKAALTSVHGHERVAEKIEETRAKHFPRTQILAADGLRAFDRGDRAAARRLLVAALLRNPAAVSLYRPAAICALPRFLVQGIVRLKGALGKPEKR
jgi:glycosyltransferase involved in cell wall biosynthesis